VSLEADPVEIITACMIFGYSCLPGYMTPGCAIPGETIIYDENVPYPPNPIIPSPPPTGIWTASSPGTASQPGTW
jgi:hypothetical protein